MKSSALGLAIAAIAFGASTIYLSVQLKDERAQADKVAESVRALNARIAELEKAREQHVVMGSFGNSALGPDAVGMGPPPPPGESNTATLENVQISRNTVLPPPPRGEAFQKMMRSNIRTNNKRIYADVGTHLGLGKEDTSKLIDMLTDQQIESFGRMREGNIEPAERKRMLDEAARDNQAELENFLGVSKAASLRDYQETIPARQETEALVRQLEGADAPLTAEQQKRMLAALVEERKRIPMPKASESTPEDYAKAYSEWQSDYSERVSAQANTILNSDQQAAYSEYQQWQKEMREEMATRRQGRGQRIPGGSVEFSAVAMPLGAVDAVAIAAPAEESPRKP